MLVLSRKVGEKIQIGKDVSIIIVSVDGNRCKIGITAPNDVRILREELIDLRSNTPDAIFPENHSVLDFAEPKEGDTVALNSEAETVDADNLKEIINKDTQSVAQEVVVDDESEETMDLDDINNLVGQFPDLTESLKKFRRPSGG
jgi:carbon storage regulator